LSFIEFSLVSELSYVPNNGIQIGNYVMLAKILTLFSIGLG